MPFFLKKNQKDHLTLKSEALWETLSTCYCNSPRISSQLSLAEIIQTNKSFLYPQHLNY